MRSPSEKITDIEYQLDGHRWRRGPKHSTLFKASSYCEKKGLQGFKATFTDGNTLWFFQMADGWNRMPWRG